MRPFSVRLRVLALMALALVLSATSSPLHVPRTLVCANDGATKPGTLFHARSLSITTTLPSHAQSIHSRMNAPVPCYWCVPSSTTYLLVQHFVPNLDGHALDPIIINTLRSAWTGVRNYMATHGDGLVPGGEFQFGRSGFGWYSVSVNNHQLTYGVVLTALNALLAFMTYNGRYGMATFWIFDGINLVGRGVFGPG